MNTKKFLKQLQEETRKNIEKHGQQLVGVIPDNDDEMFFIYTIGNYEAGNAELLYVGIRAYDAIGVLLNKLYDIRKNRGTPFQNGELVEFGAKCSVKIVNAHSPEVRKKYLTQVTNYYGTVDYAVQQVIIPDANGRFPGEEGCEEPWASQPHFGAN